MLACASTTGREPAIAVKEIVASEHAFAQRCKEKGLREAFVAFAAPGAVFFRPQPVDVRKWYADRPDSPAELTWEPTYAEISGTSDMGFSTGPWQLRTPSGKEAQGHYVTIWERQADGAWRWVIDIGTSHGEESHEVRTLISKLGQPASGKPAADAKDFLLQVDRTLGNNGPGSHADLLAKDVIYYRQGVAPLHGAGPVRAALEADARSWIWTPLAGHISTSNRLGYAYGTGAGAGHSDPELSYLRIWRKEGASQWLIVIDIAIPIAEPKKG